MKSLVAIVAGQILLGSLFALRTAPWANPDEPAHYNYVAEIAETGRLPALESTDYAHAELVDAVAAGFPDGPRAGFLHYEDHQPPLYYLLATPFFLATDGSLLALRLFGVVLGALAPVCAFLVTRRLLPERARLAPAAAAFVAFLPQQLAITASVTNDALANALVALGLLLAVRERQAPGGVALRLLLGSVVGLALLTKLTALPLLAVAVAAVAPGRERRAARLAAVLVPALLLVAPLVWRNVSLYGLLDPLALARHHAVVLGEPTTAAWIAAQGAWAWAARGVLFTFSSFWALFGWMNVFVDFRFQVAFTLLSVAAVLGLAADVRVASAGPGARLLALHALLVGLAFLAYNARFVQHQGRYLFPALVPIAFGVVRGLDRLADAVVARRVGALFWAGTLLVLLAGPASGRLQGWSLLLLVGAATGVQALPRCPPALRGWAALLPVAALPLVSAALLFLYVPG